MKQQISRQVYALSLYLLAAWLLLSACAAPNVGQQPINEEGQPVVTIFKSPT